MWGGGNTRGGDVVVCSNHLMGCPNSAVAKREVGRLRRVINSTSRKRTPAIGPRDGDRFCSQRPKYSHTASKDRDSEGREYNSAGMSSDTKVLYLMERQKVSRGSNTDKSEKGRADGEKVRKANCTIDGADIAGGEGRHGHAMGLGGESA